MKRKLLFISLQGLGNAILYLPIIKKLSISYDIDLVLSNDSVTDFYNYSPHIQNVFNIKKFLKIILLKKYDIAIASFPNCRRENIVLFFCKAKSKLCFSSKEKYFRNLFFLNYSNKKLPDGERHYIDNLSELISVKPNLTITVHDIIGHYHSENAKIVSTINSEFITLHVSSVAAKRIENEEITKVVEYLLLNRYCEFATLLGTNSERSINESIISNIDTKLQARLKLVDDVSIRDIALLMSRSKLHIGLDSSLSHLAALFQIPSLIIGHLGVHRIYPYNPNAKIIINSDIKQIGLFDNYPPHNIVRKYMQQIKSDHIISVLNDSRVPSFMLKSLENFQVPVFDIK